MSQWVLSLFNDILLLYEHYLFINILLMYVSTVSV